MRAAALQAAPVEVFESVRIIEAMKIRKFEDGFMVGETKTKEKISGETKRPAHEMLTIDRSDLAYTVKYHRVQNTMRSATLLATFTNILRSPQLGTDPTKLRADCR